MKDFNIPWEIRGVTGALEKGGFEAYLVGGCVRDLLLGRLPKDWDVTTNATPEEIQKLLPDSVYENNFGTVGVKIRRGESVEIVEVTPYRLESAYSDKRHPDEVCFTRNIEDDLKRRDFTVNAMAVSLGGSAAKWEVVDLFEGQGDLDKKIIRAVGDAGARFNEDALRILRAVRFSAELGFEIEEKTMEAIKKFVGLLDMIAKERIRDEFVKIIMSDRAKEGIELMRDLGVLKFVLPELEDGFHVKQNKSHIYDVWTHNLKALEHAAKNKWPLEIRLAALLHDVGKPLARRWSDANRDYTFYGHEVVGAKMSNKILERLKFPKKTIELVATFVRYHMFFSDTEKITLSAVRRIVRNVGPENVWDLMNVRFCDRVGMGKPKEEPYRLRKYEAMIEEAMRAPLSVSMLKIDGNRLMEVLHVKPGPKVGNILHLLFEEVMDEPEKNTQEWLEKKAAELNALSDEELAALGKKAKESKEEAEEEEIKEVRKKWGVR